MFWMICAAIALAVVGFPAALLVQRRLRQAKAAARLRITLDVLSVLTGIRKIKILQ